MLLLQGGTQSDLRIDGELLAPISEQGASVYVMTTDVAKGFCTLASTVSADLSAKGLYICTTTQIYFLAREDIDGDSTAELQLLAITPPSNITKLRAEKSFLAFISSGSVTVVDLKTMTSQTITMSGMSFIDTYRDYLAFATGSRAYTYCTEAQSFLLTNCYSPANPPTGSFTLTFIEQINNYLDAVAENIIYTGTRAVDYTQAIIAYFGNYIRQRKVTIYAGERSRLSWQGFDIGNEVVKYIGLDHQECIQADRPKLAFSVSPVMERSGYYYATSKFYKLSTNVPAKDLALEVQTSVQRTFAVDSTTQTAEDCASIKEYTTVGDEVTSLSYFFTLPDESANTFRKGYNAGWIETANKIYGWVVYFHQRTGDDPDTYKEARTALCTYVKATKAVSCVADTFRTDCTAVVPENSNTYLPRYFSKVIPFHSNFFFADKHSTTAQWAATHALRKITIFSVNDSTDTFTTRSTIDVIDTVNELVPCEVYASDTLIALLSNQVSTFVFRVGSLVPITYDITAIALGPGLAIADKNVGIHYMGLAGHWKRLFSVTAEVKNMSISSLKPERDLLAYTTATYSKVIDV